MGIVFGDLNSPVSLSESRTHQTQIDGHLSAMMRPVISPIHYQEPMSLYP